jgi:hypothetical protein
MVSEDTDQLSSGLLAIHRLDDFGDLHEALTGLVDTTVDHRDTADKLLEVALLR